jgi:hypothetical protein
MDKELEEAQSRTKDDLVGKLEEGRPANLARRSVNQPGDATVAEVTERAEQPDVQVMVLLRVPGPPRSAAEITVREVQQSETAVRTARQ